MSEQIEYCQGMKHVRKADRQEKPETAEEALPRLATLATSLGMTLTTPGDSHWVLRKAGRAVVQYWPSAQKAQICKTGKIRRGVDVPGFEILVTRGRL